MTSKRVSKRPADSKRSGDSKDTGAKKAKQKRVAASVPEYRGELVILTGLSGSGKLSALKAFEDLGYYSVDNLPLELVPRFADLVRQSAEIERAALVVDVREGMRLDEFPAILKDVRKVLPTSVVFLEATDDALIRRFSETRRPHPMGRSDTVVKSIRAERKRLDPIRNVADIVLDTTKFNVHELRARINSQFEREESDQSLMVSSNSFGFKNGVPTEADLHPKVARYVRQFPQTKEFLDKATDMLKFLLPHYIKEGKSYLTVAFGCTGGQHRSVFIAEEMKRRLAEEGYRVKTSHRDMPK